MDLDRFTDELVRDEDLRLTMYLDSKGIPTIGVGRNLRDVGISKSEAMALLRNDIGRVITDLDKYCPWWRRLDEVRQRVVANMMFNMGWETLSQFKHTLGAMESAKFDVAADGMLASAWAKQVGPRAVRLAEMMRRGSG